MRTYASFTSSSTTTYGQKLLKKSQIPQVENKVITILPHNFFLKFVEKSIYLRDTPRQRTEHKSQQLQGRKCILLVVNAAFNHTITPIDRHLIPFMDPATKKDYFLTHKAIARLPCVCLTNMPV